jgi:hypothetical protein
MLVTNHVLSGAMRVQDEAPHRFKYEVVAGGVLLAVAVGLLCALRRRRALGRDHWPLGRD